MNNRLPSYTLLIGLVLLLTAAAACGEDSSPDQSAPATAAETTTTTAPPPTTRAPETTTTEARQATTAPETTTTSPAEFQPTLIAYRYLSNPELEYAISIEQNSVIEIDGGPPGEQPPGPISVDVVMAGTMSYLTGPGPREDTFSVRMVSDLEVVEVDASMGGMALPGSDFGDVTGLQNPIDITLVVDEQGNIVEVSSNALDGLMGGMDSMLGASAGNQQLNRPFGPAFPDHEVGLNDSWTEESVQEGPGGPIVTTAVHRVVAVEGSPEAPILVVESEYQTETFEWDMSQMMSAMFGAFTEETPEEGAEEAEGLLSDFSLVIEVAPGAMTATSRFDVEAGVVIDGSYQAPGMVITHTTVPDETGEPFTLSSSVEFHQEVFYELISPAA